MEAGEKCSLLCPSQGLTPSEKSELIKILFLSKADFAAPALSFSVISSPFCHPGNFSSQKGFELGLISGNAVLSPDFHSEGVEPGLEMQF